MTWVVADARSMGEPGGAFEMHEKFDFVFEKGTFDAIEGDADTLRRALLQSRKVLKPGGKLISVTIRSDARRDQFADAYNRDPEGIVDKSTGAANKFDVKSRCPMSRKLLQGGTHIHVCTFD